MVDLPGVNEGAAREVLRGFKQALVAATSELIAVQGRVESLRQTVSGMERVLGPETAPQGESLLPENTGTVLIQDQSASIDEERVSRRQKVDYPTGIPAARSVLVDRAVPLNAEEVTAELIQRGWPPRSPRPVSAVRTALRRLEERDAEIVRLPGGRYVVQGSGQGDMGDN